MNTQELTVEAKHIFLDIVNYTYNRSIEAQSDLISILNDIVTAVIAKHDLSNDRVIFIPTGDGMCISLINVNSPYDIHLKIALDILNLVNNNNEKQEDSMRRFDLRIGINENVDNLITDINGQNNISGSGKIFASRIESLCDKNQILVGNQVFERLTQREKYMNTFFSYTTTVKHGTPLQVHHYTNGKLKYLNNDIPSKFRQSPKKINVLSTLQGYYMSLCITNEDFISKNLDKGQSLYSLHVLFFQLAEDHFEINTARKTDSPRKNIERSLEDQFIYNQSIDFWIICDLNRFILDSHFRTIVKYFSDPYLFVNEKGKKKLIEDQPDICKEFGIENLNN